MRSNAAMVDRPRVVASRYKDWAVARVIGSYGVSGDGASLGYSAGGSCISGMGGISPGKMKPSTSWDSMLSTRNRMTDNPS